MVNWNDLNMGIYIGIFGKAGNLKYDSEMRKFLNITAVNQYSDFEIDEHSQSHHTFRDCTQADLERLTTDQKILREAMNVTPNMICLEEAENINLQGHAYENTNRKKHLIFYVSKCRGETCEQNQTKVDEYLQSLYIFIDGVFQNINFQEREGKPVYSYIKRLVSYDAKTHVKGGDDITGLWVFDQYKQNTLKTFDSFFNTGTPTYEHTYYDLGLNRFFPFTSKSIAPGGEGWSQQWAPGNLIVYEIYLTGRTIVVLGCLCCLQYW